MRVYGIRGNFFLNNFTNIIKYYISTSFRESVPEAKSVRNITMQGMPCIHILLVEIITKNIIFLAMIKRRLPNNKGSSK